MEREKVISVVPGLTQWSVRERELENPTAYFTTCNEAIKYAKAIAETKRTAVVRIMDKNGNTISEQHFDMNS
jgi:phosphopantetheine adenylyltransferase